MDVNFLALRTDAMRHPIVWSLLFNAVKLFFESGPKTWFSNRAMPDPLVFQDPPVPEPSNSRACCAVFLGDPLVGTLVGWRRAGGTLTLILLPAPLLLFLGGLGALALLRRWTQPAAAL